MKHKHFGIEFFRVCFEQTKQKGYLPILALLAVHGLFMFAISLLFDVHADMLDHWLAGRFWSTGYYEHPPMIFWVLSLFTGWLVWLPAEQLTVVAPVVLKFFAVVWNSVVLFQFARLAIYLQPKVRFFPLFFLLTTLYFSLGLFFINVDHPFLLFWLLASLRFVRYIKEQDNHHLVWMGVYVGLSALSKYTAVLFWVVLLCFLLRTKRFQHAFFNRYFWFAGLLSLLLVVPVLYWNWQNDFVSFRFQFDRALTGRNSWFNIANFSLGHLFLFAPFYSFFAWRAWVKLRNQFKVKQKAGETTQSAGETTQSTGETTQSAGETTQSTAETTFSHDQTTTLFSPKPASPAQKNSFYQDVACFLNWQILMPLLLFTYSAYSGSVSDPKWMNIAYLALFLRISFVEQGLSTSKKKSKAFFLQRQLAIFPQKAWRLKFAEINFFVLKSVRRFFSSEYFASYSAVYFFCAYFFNFALAAFIFFQANYYFLSLPHALQVKLEETQGWAELAKEMDNLLQQNNQTLPPYLVTREYQLGAWLAFYNPNQPLTYSLEKAQRNQWSPYAQVVSKGALFVCPPSECKTSLAKAIEHFAVKESDFKGMGWIQYNFSSGRARKLNIYLYHPKPIFVLSAQAKN